jgi:hypothetical protein
MVRVYYLPCLSAVCPDGKGTSNDVNTANTDDCSDCASGYFNGGSTDLACTACPQPTDGSSTFNFQYGGSDNPVTVVATTEPGAASPQQCVLEFASIITANW